MRWICKLCKAINPEFSYTCHNCGKHRLNNGIGMLPPYNDDINADDYNAWKDVK